MRSVQINEKPALIMGIITALFCCMPGGVVALIIAQSAKTAAANGDQAGAESKLRMSMAISGVSMVIMFAVLCLYFAVVVLANA